MKKNRNVIKKIGLVDSGSGGLPILSTLSSTIKTNYLYYADTKSHPYGSKSQEELIEIVKNILHLMLYKEVDLIVIACHTLSTILYKVSRENSFPIPLLNVIDPIFGAALAITKKKLGILGTPFTINAQLHRNLILANKPELEVIEQACPDLAFAIEQEAESEKIDTLLQHYLAPLADVDTIMLACTHYSFIRKRIEQIMPHVQVIAAEDAIIPYISAFSFSFVDARERMFEFDMSGEPSPLLQKILNTGKVSDVKQPEQQQAL